MSEHLAKLIELAGGGLELAVLAIVFVGILMTFLGASSLLGPTDPLERRLAHQRARHASLSSVAIRKDEASFSVAGFRRFITPVDPRERQKVQQQLERAGFRGEQAYASYFLVRAILGLLLPMPLILNIIAKTATGDPQAAFIPFVDFDLNTNVLLACLSLLIGFYGPPFWLRRRIIARQRAIRYGFPHALDMIQVAIEAGLGFDSALARVANELKHAHPALAEEFAIVGLELRAGKPREQVLTDLADRTQVEAISVFAKAIVQSITFGTSVASTLQVYAREMRHQRMTLAEERANQLPVKMSVIMVVFLLPTIFLMALSPVVIRLVRMLAGTSLPIS
jgi:tight adherence protein C